MAPRKAIWLGPTGNLEVIVQTAAYKPRASQTLVRVAYSAVNPADLRHSHMGMRSYVAGYDWLGTAEAVGPSSPFAPGDVLFGFSEPGHRRPAAAGAHQDYLLAETFNTWRVADVEVEGGAASSLAWTQLVAWPAVLATAVDALFNTLGFAFPSLGAGSAAADGVVVDGADPRGRAILIWGGSSQVGLFAIQLARAAGFSPIYTTASARNHETLISLGATRCFDYNSGDETVVDEVRAAVADDGRELSVIFDAVTAGTGWAEPPSDTPVDVSKSSPAIARRCLSDGAADVRLSATLVVEHDPDWAFCLSVRKPDEFPEWNARLNAVVDWVLAHQKTVGLRVPKVKVVKGAEEGIKAIHDVFAGKVSLEKVVLEHPLL